MTNERAIELLHRLQDEQFDGIHGDERREALDMAVRALFSQQIVNDSQGLVNDCISRKMAIDAFEPEHDTDWYTPRIIEVLEALPPVQPTQTNADSTQNNALERVKGFPIDADLLMIKVLKEYGIMAHDRLYHIIETMDKYELPSAQPEVAKDTNVPTNDCISRQAAIDALWKALYEYEDKTEKQFKESDELDVGDWILHRVFVQNMSDIDRRAILDLPSAQPERKKGKWILIKGSNGKDYHKCSECLHTQEITGVKNYCAVCGADMRGESDG